MDPHPNPPPFRGRELKRFDHSRAQTSQARSLRRDMTDVEKKLWWRLRGEQLGCSFRRQHPVGPYVLDFVCAPIRLAIEVDGHQHGTDEAQTHDRRREDFLAKRGICTIRFANHGVSENLEGVLETIWNKVQGLTNNADCVLPLKGGCKEGVEADTGVREPSR